MERLAVRRLHLDAVAGSDVGIEFEARYGEAFRSPPPRELVGVAEGLEHNRWSRGKCAPYSRVSLLASGSSERLNDSMVRTRSLLAISAATGFINRIMPKRSPSAT